MKCSAAPAMMIAFAAERPARAYSSVIKSLSAMAVSSTGASQIAARIGIGVDVRPSTFGVR